MWVWVGVHVCGWVCMCVWGHVCACVWVCVHVWGCVLAAVPAISLQPGYDMYERATYAALSGNLKHLLPACSSWYDHLWGHLTVLLDVKREQVSEVSAGVCWGMGLGACQGVT